MINFNDRRALRAANKGSLAPKGYQPDSRGRQQVKGMATMLSTKFPNRKQNFAQATQIHEASAKSGAIGY